MDFWAVNIQSKKERIMKIVKTESNLRKVIVKFITMNIYN